MEISTSDVRKESVKKVGLENKPTIHEQLKELSNTIVTLSRESSPDKAQEIINTIEVFDTLYNSIIQPDYQHQIALQRRYIAEGDYYARLDKHAYAVRSYKNAFNLYDSHNDDISRYTTMAANRLAQQYRKIGLTNEALETLNRGYEIALLISDRRTTGDILDTMGNFFSEIGDYQKSVEYHKISLEIAQEIQSDKDIAYSYNNIASSYQSLGEYELSIKLYLQSIEIKERINDVRGIATSLNNIGNSLVRMEKFAESEEYFKRSIDIKRTLNQPSLLASSLIGLASVYSKQNKTQELQAVLGEVLDFAKNCDSESMLLYTKQQLSEIYAQQGNYEQAYSYLLESYQINEKQRIEQYQKRLTNLIAVFEVNRHEQEATIQKIKAEQLQRDLDAKNNELTATALNLVKKNEVLQQLKEHIENNDKPNEAGMDSILQTIRKEINSSLADDKSWERFEEQFNLIHVDFLRTIARLYPSLSPVELRICTLLKINLSSKEIASMLCIEAKTVEVYRYRIRQKMKLEQGTNLVQHLISF